MAGSCFKKLLRLVVCKTSFYLFQKRTTNICKMFTHKISRIDLNFSLTHLKLLLFEFVQLRVVQWKLIEVFAWIYSLPPMWSFRVTEPTTQLWQPSEQKTAPQFITITYLDNTSMPIKSSGRIVPPGWAPLQPKQSVLSLIV